MALGNGLRRKFGNPFLVTFCYSPIASKTLSLRFLHFATSFPVVTVVLKLYKAIPVMAAVAVRKKVVSIGHFSQNFIFNHCNCFYLLDEIKSNCMY